MKVYHVEVNSNGWRYSAEAGDIDCATLDGILAVKKCGDGDFEKLEWEMNIYTVNVLI